jgi:hypothetical protein
MFNGVKTFVNNIHLPCIYGKHNREKFCDKYFQSYHENLLDHIQLKALKRQLPINGPLTF